MSTGSACVDCWPKFSEKTLGTVRPVHGWHVPRKLLVLARGDYGAHGPAGQSSLKEVEEGEGKFTGRFYATRESLGTGRADGDGLSRRSRLPGGPRTRARCTAKRRGQRRREEIINTRARGSGSENGFCCCLQPATAGCSGNSEDRPPGK